MEAMLIASTAFNAVGSYMQGKQEQMAFQAKSQADAYNAAVMKQRSDQVLSAAGQREEQQRRMARIAEGKMRASIAESGAGVDGTNADVLRQSEIFAELDALNIRYEGQVESQGLLAQSELDSYQSRQNARYSKLAGRLTYFNSASQILAGGSKMYASGSKAGGGGTGG
jgi:hypothetical protein